MRRTTANRGGQIFSRQQPLRGLSFLEFMGCLTAIAGGMLLGTLYLGVDIQTATMNLLRKSELIESQWLVAGEEGSGDRPGESEVVPTQTASGQKAPMATVGQESSARASTPGEGELEPMSTRKFWGKLLQVMRQEATGRQENSKGPLFEFLVARQQRHQRAADAIASLGQPHGADEKVLAYAEQTIRWHQAGADLYGRVAQLLTVAPATEWSGPFAQSWQSAATQHRMEERLLLSKQKAVFSYLNSPSVSDVPVR